MVSAQDDIYEVAVKQLLYGQRVINTFHFKQKVSGDDGEAQRLAADFHTSMLTTFLTGRSNNLTVDLISCRKVQGAGTLQHDEYVTPAAAGSLAGQAAAAPQLAVVVSWRTPQAGRSHRGRTYLAGFTDADENGGVWGTNTTNFATAWADAMLARYGVGVATTNWDFGIWSRPYAAYTSYNPKTGAPIAHGAYAGNFTAITGRLIRATAFNQRRRTVGIGS
jgi:hypothetical protein